MLNKKSAGSIEVILLVILVVILAGSLVYVLVTNNNSAQKAPLNTSPTDSNKTNEPAADKPKVDTSAADATKSKTEVQNIYNTYVDMAKKVDTSSYASTMAPGNYLKQYLTGAAADTSRLGHTGPGLGVCWAEVAQSVQFNDSVKDGPSYKVSGKAVGSVSGETYPIDVFYDVNSGKIVDYKCS